MSSVMADTGTVASREVLSRLKGPYFLYQVLAHLLMPLVILVFLWRSRREPAYRHHMSERFGRTPAPVRERPVLVFAASLGETRAAKPLVDALLASGRSVWLAHSSPAGRIEGARLFADRLRSGCIIQSYMPLDLFWCVRRALSRMKPRACLVMEAEIWPALVHECAHADCPVIQTNGSLNDRSVAKARSSALNRFRLAHLSAYERILTKAEHFARNYRSMGVSADRIRIVGELRFDLSPDVRQTEAARTLRNAHIGSRPVFLVASSVADEETALAKIVKQVLALASRPFVIWAPRSPQRFDAVHELCKGISDRVCRRTTVFDAALAGDLDPGADILVGDSIGEMAFYYECADLVFVGASLNGHGGHNIIEPLMQGRPVVMGPSTFGIVFPAEEAAEGGAFESLADAKAVADRVVSLLGDPAMLAAFAARARSFGAEHTGVAARSLSELEPYLGAVAEAASSPSRT